MLKAVVWQPCPWETIDVESFTFIFRSAAPPIGVEVKSTLHYFLFFDYSDIFLSLCIETLRIYFKWWKKTIWSLERRAVGQVPVTELWHLIINVCTDSCFIYCVVSGWKQKNFPMKWFLGKKTKNLIFNSNKVTLLMRLLLESNMCPI